MRESIFKKSKRRLFVADDLSIRKEKFSRLSTDLFRCVYSESEVQIAVFNCKVYGSSERQLVDADYADYMSMHRPP